MTDLDASLHTLLKTRQSLVAITDALEDDARLTVPDGFSNHVLWNLAHVVVTQQLLVYGLSGLPLNVPDEWVLAYRKGTSATTGESVASYADVREAALELPSRTRADLEA
ncbi:DinB family protein, partial [Rubrivirga sp.]|uniref:DinB family protein n=1 Tax=Rubrivirga sp. TaxID=1885344 RepID=UPI003C73EF20